MKLKNLNFIYHGKDNYFESIICSIFNIIKKSLFTIKYFVIN